MQKSIIYKRQTLKLHQIKSIERWTLHYQSILIQLHILMQSLTNLFEP